MAQQFVFGIDVHECDTCNGTGNSAPLKGRYGWIGDDTTNDTSVLDRLDFPRYEPVSALNQIGGRDVLNETPNKSIVWGLMATACLVIWLGALGVAAIALNGGI